MADQTPIQLVIEALDKSQAILKNVNAEMLAMEGGAKRASTSTQTLTGHINQGSSALKSMRAEAELLAGRLVALFAVERIIHYTKSAIEAAEAVGDLAEETGLAVQEINNWTAAAKNANSNSQQLSMAFKTFSKFLVESNDSTSEAATKLRIMGFSQAYVNNQHKDFGTVLKDVTGKLATYSQNQDRTNLIGAIFGDKIAPKMIRVINDYASATKAASGPNQAQIDQWKEMEPVLNRAGTQLQGIYLTLALKLLPTIVSTIEAFTDFEDSGSNLEVVFDALNIVLKVFVSGLMVTLTGLRQMGTIIGSIAFAATAAAKGEFRAAAAALGDMNKEIERLSTANEIALANLWDPQKKPGAGGVINITKPGGGTTDAPVDKTVLLMEHEAEIARHRTEAEEKYQLQLLETQRLLNNGSITADEATDRNVDNAGEYKEALEAIIVAYKELAKVSATDYPKISEDAAAKAAALRLPVAQTRLVEEQPTGVAKGFMDFQNSLASFNNTAALTSRTMNATLKPAIDGVSKGIYGALTGTMKWGDAMRQTASAIAQGLIQIGVEMVAQLLIQQTVHAAQIAMCKMGIIANSSEAAAKGASSVASIPWIGPVLAIAAIAAILAAGMALTGGFAAGGYTGSGSRMEAAGIVHRGEVVIPAAQVAAFGPAHFEAAYFRGRMPGYASGGLVGGLESLPMPSTAPNATRIAQAAANAAPMNVAIGIVNTRADQRRFQRTEGTKMVVDHMKKRSNKLRA